MPSLPLFLSGGLNGLGRENGGQGSERRPGSRVQRGDGERAQCENCCMKSKVSSRQMHFLFCSYRAACPEYLTGFMPRYSPMLTSDKRLSGLISNLFISESEINISLNVQPALL